MANFLDALLGAIRVKTGGAPMPRRSAVNFASGLTVTDDPDNDQTNVSADGLAIISPTSVVFELTRALGGDNFHGLAFTQFNGLGAIGSDFVSGPVGLLKPVTIMRVDLSPDGGGATYHPTIGFGAGGVQAGWLVYVIVTRGGGSTSLGILNGTNGSDPLVTLAPADYFDTSTGNNHYRVHSLLYTGPGAQIDGKGWQRITPYGAPALV